MSQAAYYDSMTNEFKINGGSNHSWGSAAPRSLLGLDASSQLVGYLLTDREILQGRTGNTPLASTNLDVDDLKVRGNVTLLGQVASDISPSLDNTWSLGSAILSWMYIWVRNVVTAALNVSGLARFTATSTVIFESSPQLTTATASSLLSTDASKNMHSSIVSNSNGCNTAVDANGDINFSMTQNLDPTATVEFVGERLTGLTASSLIATNATKDLVTSGITNNNGNELKVSATGQLTASLVQDLRPTATPEFKTEILSNLTAGSLVCANASKTLASSIITNSNGNNISITGAGNITASLDQDLRVTASPQFARETLTATTNQLVMGTTRTITINAPTPATSSRIHTIPDVSANASFILSEGNQTVNGEKSMSGITRITNTTQSTVFTDGALVVDGGVGVTKALRVGGTGNFSGVINAPSGIVFGSDIMANYNAPSSFTPTLTSSGSSSGITYTSQSGRWWRVGKTVHINFYIQTVTKLSSAGNIFLANLPVTVNVGNPQNILGAAWGGAVVAGNQFVISPVGATTIANVNRMSTTLGYANVLQTDMNDVIILAGGFWYDVA